MQTIVRHVHVSNRDEPIEISVDGVLKRKFLLHLLKKRVVLPSYDVAILLREAIEDIHRVRRAIPSHDNTSEKLFNKMWGGILNALEHGMIDSSTKEYVELLRLAHIEFDELHGIEKTLDICKPYDWKKQN